MDIRTGCEFNLYSPTGQFLGCDYGDPYLQNLAWSYRDLYEAQQPLRIYSNLYDDGYNLSTVPGTLSTIDSGVYGKVNNLTGSALSVNNIYGDTSIRKLNNEVDAVTTLHLIL